jgi:hypothetical protein
MSKSKQRTSFEDYEQPDDANDTAAGRLGHGRIEFLPPSSGYNKSDDFADDAKTWTGDQSAFD